MADDPRNRYWDTRLVRLRLLFDRAQHLLDDGQLHLRPHRFRNRLLVSQRVCVHFGFPQKP